MHWSKFTAKINQMIKEDSENILQVVITPMLSNITFLR